VIHDPVSASGPWSIKRVSEKKFLFRWSDLDCHKTENQRIVREIERIREIREKELRKIF